jgi:hypothetical protein
MTLIYVTQQFPHISVVCLHPLCDALLIRPSAVSFAHFVEPIFEL